MAAAEQRCTMQVSGDGASPVPLMSQRDAGPQPLSFSPAVSGCISCSEILCDFKASLNVKDKVRSLCSSPCNAVRSSKGPGWGCLGNAAASGVEGSRWQ